MARPGEPKAIIKDGKVVNADELRRYWRYWNEREYYMRRGMFADQAVTKLEEPKPQIVEHIVWHSEMSKKEFDLLQQTALKARHLEKVLAKLLTRKKPANKRPNYKGIEL